MKNNTPYLFFLLILGSLFISIGCQSSAQLAEGLPASGGQSHKEPATTQPVAMTSTPTSPAVPPPSGHIAFISSRNGKKNLFMMNADGTDQTPLTHDESEDASPRWSLDGTRIAFASIVNKTEDIYILKVANGAISRLTNNTGSDAFPSWSPDGQAIAFESFQSGQWGVYVATTDGSGSSALTDDAGYTNPAWSPRDPLIAFVGDSDSRNANIYLTSLDQRLLTNLTNDLHPSTDPIWSPDGNRIAFRFFPSPQVANICIINRDGTNRHCLTDSQWENGIPAWSPDEHWLAFRSIRSGTSDIDLLNVDDGSLRTLITGVAVKGDPIWSPDGSRLVFSGCPQGIASESCANNTYIQIYSIVINTHEITQLTNSPGYNGDPAWTAR